MIHIFSLILSLILLEFVLQPVQSRLQTNSPHFLFPLLSLLTHHKSNMTLYIAHIYQLIILSSGVCQCGKGARRHARGNRQSCLRHVRGVASAGSRLVHCTSRFSNFLRSRAIHLCIPLSILHYK
jgi:hypothetical protein